MKKWTSSEARDLLSAAFDILFIFLGQAPTLQLPCVWCNSANIGNNILVTYYSSVGVFLLPIQLFTEAQIRGLMTLDNIPSGKFTI